MYIYIHIFIKLIVLLCIYIYHHFHYLILNILYILLRYQIYSNSYTDPHKLQKFAGVATHIVTKEHMNEQVVKAQGMMSYCQYLYLGIQSPCQSIGVYNHLRKTRYLGSINILRRWARIPRV